MAFQIDHVGAVVDVEITSRQWSAEATLFAVSTDGDRITVPHASMASAGPSRGIAAITKRYAGPPLPEDPGAHQAVFDAYRVQRHDVEDAINQLPKSRPRHARGGGDRRLDSPIGNLNRARIYSGNGTQPTSDLPAS